LGAEMKIELAGIGDREEVLSQPWIEQEHGGADGQERGDEYGSMIDAGRQNTAVRLTSTLKTAFERSLNAAEDVPGGRRRRRVMTVRFEQVHRERRHQGSR